MTEIVYSTPLGTCKQVLVKISGTPRVARISELSSGTRAEQKRSKTVFSTCLTQPKIFNK